MTVRLAGSTWNPLGRQTQPRMRAHDIWCLHTMAGSFAGTDSMFHAGGYTGLESHTGVRADGYAAVVSGAGPTVLVLTAEGSDGLLERCPDGWTAHALEVDRAGVRTVPS